MLIRYIRLVLLLWIGFLLFLLTFSLLTVARLKDNPLTRYSARTQLDLNNGVETLLNCTFFRRAYPQSYHALTKFKRTYFLYDPQEDVDANWAEADSYSNVVHLSRAFFLMQTPRKREAIIGHEVLHLIGMPGHKTPIDYNHDAVYITELACFGDIDDLD